MLASSHTRPPVPAAFMASEYLPWKLSSEPAVRPTTVISDGPTLFLSVLASWQAMHLLKTFFPAAASPSAFAGRMPMTPAAKSAETNFADNFMMQFPPVKKAAERGRNPTLPNRQAWPDVPPPRKVGGLSFRIADCP